MTSNDIISFLSSETNTADFKKVIDTDVENYIILLKKTGSSIQLNFHDDGEINLDTKKLIRLLNETRTGNLSSAHLAYVCDCLTLADCINYENEKIQDIVFSIADPEINGGYKSTDEIEQILISLV